MPQLIGPGDLIVASWQNLRRNIKVYADFLVWFALLAVIHWAMQVGIVAVIPDKILRSITLAVLSLPITLVIMALTASLIDATAKGLQQKPIDVRASLSIGMHKLIPFIWVSILSTLMVALGFVLLVIPGFIFLVWYRFAQNFTVIDDVRGSAAMSASRRLVTGRWWSVFVRIALPALFFSVASSFFVAVAYLLIGSAMGDPGLFFGRGVDIDTLPMSQTLVMRVLPQVINGLFFPLYVGSELLLWFDLKKNAPPAA